jgi:hypothetical protein
MAWDAGATGGAAVRATADVVVTMFMEKSFAEEGVRPAGAHSPRPGKAALLPATLSLQRRGREDGKGSSPYPLLVEQLLDRSTQRWIVPSTAD